MSEENNNTNHLEILTKSFKDMFETFIDDDTKELINDISNADPKEKVNLFSKYMKEHASELNSSVSFGTCLGNENCEAETCDIDGSDIDNLVKQKRVIDSKIENLSEKDKFDFWIKYHNIPNNTNEKLDVLVSTLTTLNANINERFDDINTEITILKKHIGK